MQVTAQPLLLEVEKIASRQMQGTWASIYTGFVNIQRNGRIVVDPTQDIDDAPWPAWMPPYSD